MPVVDGQATDPIAPLGMIEHVGGLGTEPETTAADRGATCTSDVAYAGILKVFRTYATLVFVSATKSPVGEPVSSTYQPR